MGAGKGGENDQIAMDNCVGHYPTIALEFCSLFLVNQVKLFADYYLQA
jgi:hypothetical protein